MTARITALAFALVAIGLTLAQDVLPGRAWYHTWQCITLLALALAVTAAYAWQGARGGDGVRGRKLAVALLGAAVVGAAGTVAALIGPDTVTVVGTPGTVTPVPDLGAAAFFGTADAATIDRGDAAVTLRRRGAPPLEVRSRPQPLDLAVVVAQPHPAAFVIARDAHGNRLTVTQPNNPSFLSPVLLFRGEQPIRDQTFPYDTFAVPAMHRVVHALYFSPADLASFRHTAPTEGGIVLSATDEDGKEDGLTIAPSGRPVTLAGMELTLTMGTFPELLVAAAPQPVALIGGLVLFLAGCIWAMWPVEAERREAGSPDAL